MLAEDYVIILDYLSRGKSTGFKTEPLAQAMGTQHFTLLELTPKAGADLNIGEKVYVGKEDRDKIEFVKGRISYKELTNTAVSELEKIVANIVVDEEQRFLKFYNESIPITIKRHQLELLPGLGKKHMLKIVQEREIKPFESYEDLEKRVPLISKPAKLIAKRIMEELEGREDKYFLFTRPPAKKREFDRDRRSGGFRRDYRGSSRDRS